MKPEVNFYTCELGSMGNQLSNQYHKAVLPINMLSVWLEGWSLRQSILMWSLS